MTRMRCYNCNKSGGKMIWILVSEDYDEEGSPQATKAPYCKTCFKLLDNDIQEQYMEEEVKIYGRHN